MNRILDLHPILVAILVVPLLCAGCTEGEGPEGMNNGADLGTAADMPTSGDMPTTSGDLVPNGCGGMSAPERVAGESCVWELRDLDVLWLRDHVQL